MLDRRRRPGARQGDRRWRRRLDPGALGPQRRRRRRHGNAENYAFARDGSYRLQALTMVDLNGCKSRGAGIETGTYTSDGKTLVLTPGQATFTGSICSGSTKQERARITPPRRYQIGLSRDGRLIFVGTGCTPFPAASCTDHVRWEMTVEKPAGK